MIFPKQHKGQKMRRIPAYILKVLISTFLVSIPAVGQQDFSAVQIKTTKVTDGIYMLEGSGGNLGLCVGSDGAFLIDDQYAPLTEKILKAVEEITDQPVKYVFNTHWHGDHTGGNENLGKTGALIVAHEFVRARMSTDQFIEAFNSKVPAAPLKALPVVTFTESVTFHLNGDQIQAIHVSPAHTDGDSFIYFQKANVLHTGDLYFSNGYPFIDLTSGGSLQGMIDAADRILALMDQDTRIIAGHGPLKSVSDYKEFRDMLAMVQARIFKLIAEGKSIEEVVAAKPTSDLDEKWGQSFMQPDAFVRIAYSSLAGQ